MKDEGLCTYCKHPAVAHEARVYEQPLGFSRSERPHRERTLSADHRTVTWAFPVCLEHAPDTVLVA